MIKEILSKVGVSQANLERKYGVHRTMIGKVLKKSKVDWIKRKSAPKCYSGQMERAKKAADTLSRDFFPSLGSTNIVIDDESYFGLKDDITPGNVSYHKKSETSARDVSEEVRFRTKASTLRSFLCGYQYTYISM